MTAAQIQEKRRSIERMLSNLPATLVEARRYIAEQISREPEPQFLQCMVKVARDAAAEGPRRDIPRSLLSVRAVADEQLARFDDDGPQDPAAIQEAAAILQDLEKALDLIKVKLDKALPELQETDRDYLTGIHDRLAPSREKLLTAKVLSRFYDLDKRPALPRAGGAAARGGAILLYLIGLDLSAWMEAHPTQAADVAALPAGERDRLWDNLNQCRDAYKAVGKQIAARKDKAFMEGGREEYDILNRIQRQLFSAYSRLSKTLSAGKDGPPVRTTEDPGHQQALQDSIAEAEQAAEALNEANEERREVMDDALRGVRESRTAASRPLSRLEREDRDRNRRLLVLITVCTVLAVGAVAVNFMLTEPRGTVVELNPQDFVDAMPLRNAIPADTLMLAETEAGLWDGWSPAERRDHVQRLTREADIRGFSSLLLSDESGRQLAFWQHGSKASVF